MLSFKNNRQSVLTMPDKKDEWGALTQQVFRAVCVVVIVVREMVDSVTAALIDPCRTKTDKCMNYSSLHTKLP